MIGEIDFAIARDFNIPKDFFDVTTLANDELVVLTSNDHPFVERDCISFSDLKNEN